MAGRLRIRHDELGQTLPLVALCMLALLGMLALILDGAWAYAQRRYAQNAADAGALAGATTIVHGSRSDSAVRAAAQAFVERNRSVYDGLVYINISGTALPNPTNGVVPSDAEGVRVTAHLTFDTFFANVVGFPSMTASAQASAMAKPAPPPGSMDNVAPLSVPENEYDACTTPGQYCQLWDPQYMKVWDTAGNFKTFVDLSDGTATGSKPQLVGDWTNYGYPGWIGVPAWYPCFEGDVGNNVADGLRQRLDRSGFWDDVDGHWGYVDMLIWSDFQRADHAADTPMRVYVTKFARFKVRYDDIRSNKVMGYFEKFIIPGYWEGPGGDPAGPKIVVLVD